MSPDRPRLVSALVAIAMGISAVFLLRELAELIVTPANGLVRAGLAASIVFVLVVLAGRLASKALEPPRSDGAPTAEAHDQTRDQAEALVRDLLGMAVPLVLASRGIAVARVVRTAPREVEIYITTSPEARRITRVTWSELAHVRDELKEIGELRELGVQVHLAAPNGGGGD